MPPDIVLRIFNLDHYYPPDIVQKVNLFSLMKTTPPPRSKFISQELPLFRSPPFLINVPYCIISVSQIEPFQPGIDAHFCTSHHHNYHYNHNTRLSRPIEPGNIPLLGPIITVHDIGHDIITSSWCNEMAECVQHHNHPRDAGFHYTDTRRCAQICT